MTSVVIDVATRLERLGLMSQVGRHRGHSQTHPHLLCTGQVLLHSVPCRLYLRAEHSWPCLLLCCPSQQVLR